MKRRDLERHLKKHGARLLREGDRHSYWGTRWRGTEVERSASMIAYPLARAICKQLSIPPPTGSR